MTVVYPSVGTHSAVSGLNRSLIEMLTYLSDETGVIAPDRRGLWPTWQSHGHSHSAVRAIQAGDFPKAKRHIEAGWQNIEKEKTGLNVSYLLDDPYSRPKMDLIAAELGGYTERQIGIGYATDESRRGDSERLKVLQALSILEAYAPSFYDEVNAVVNEIVLCGPNDGVHIRSASNFNLFGLITFWADPIHTCVYYLQHIVHEVAHQRLFLLTMDDEIALNPLEQTFAAPFRPDPRPMIGIYHAMFVLARMVIALRIIKQAAVPSSQLADLDAKLANAEKRFFDSAQQVAEHGVLTEVGRAVFQECCEAVGDNKVVDRLEVA